MNPEKLSLRKDCKRTAMYNISIKKDNTFCITYLQYEKPWIIPHILQNLPDLYSAFSHILNPQSAQISWWIFNIRPWLEPWIAGGRIRTFYYYIEIQLTSEQEVTRSREQRKENLFKQQNLSGSISLISHVCVCVCLCVIFDVWLSTT